MFRLKNKYKTYLTELFILSASIIIIIISRNSTTFITNVFIARTGVSALSSAALVSSLFNVIAIFCSGLLSTTSIFIAEARGKEKESDYLSILLNGLLIATILAIVFILILGCPEWFFSKIIHANINTELIVSYCNALQYGLLPLLWHITLQQYLIGHQKTLIVTSVTVASLPIQIFLSYGLTLGKYGMPFLGIFGAGLAFSITSWLIFIFLGVSVILQSKKNTLKSLPGIKLTQLLKFINIGWSIGITYTMEAAALFCFIIIMSKFGTDLLAVYHVITQCMSITIIFAIGIAQAATVLIGKLYGAQKMAEIPIVYYLALILVIVIMLPIYISYVFFSEIIFNLFKLENLSFTLTSTVSSMFIILATYQLVDATRIILLGALRGLQITQKPMIIVAGTYFGIGLPSSYVAVEYFKQGPLVALALITTTVFLSTLFLLTYLNTYIGKNKFSNRVMLASRA